MASTTPTTVDELPWTRAELEQAQALLAQAASAPPPAVPPDPTIEALRILLTPLVTQLLDEYTKRGA